MKTRTKYTHLCIATKYFLLASISLAKIIQEAMWIHKDVARYNTYVNSWYHIIVLNTNHFPPWIKTFRWQQKSYYCCTTTWNWCKLEIWKALLNTQQEEMFEKNKNDWPWWWHLNNPLVYSIHFYEALGIGC